ncbi:MAG TPA: hypothetical protein DEH25_15060 [Chloroflexi bacterium]|nr:hypothetical protein [Chloroflexota bacterium]HBY09441.1 hypothetical protein [Chloroflexota bacterium]
MENLTGKNLGKYKLEELVGRGGMADVYKGYHPNLKRYVAIKVLHQHLNFKEDYLERFKREAAAVAQLRHYNIVQVYDFDFEGTIPYMVMEFIAGETLEDRLVTRSEFQYGLSLNETNSIFLPLAEAIKYAHSQGVIHRDIKPSNIMFTSDGQIVLADFGIAHVIGNPDFSLDDAFIGTPKFMSPEQCNGAPADARSDIYSLGILLFLLLTGEPPFRGTTVSEFIMHHLYTLPPRASDFNPEISVQIDDVICKTLEKLPEARYQTVDDLLHDYLEAAEIQVRILKATWEAEPDYGILDDSVKPYIGTDILASPMKQEHTRTPFQAPRDILDFVGRSAALDELSATLLGEPIANLVCITGMGGVGKSALATRVAHAFHSHFPDGVLWANLATSEPLAILDSWAHALGVDLSRLPDFESRAAALRSILSDKKVMLILDDIRDPEDARLLLPGGSGCVSIMTTRNLDFPVALEAYEIHLFEMSISECRQIMAQIVGQPRVDAEAQTAEEIINLLGGLPLAVKIAARRLASRRRWRLEDLFIRLSDEKSRLDVLRMSDIAVRSSIAISWDDLDRELKRTFSLVAVFDERPFSASAMAAIAGIERSTMCEHLDTLVSYSLLFEQGDRHYRQHTLLSDFAREQLGDDSVILRRMAEFYLSYANEYCHQFLALEQEQANIAVGMRVVYEWDLWEKTLAYAEALHEFWISRGYFSTARQGYQWACEAAENLADQSRLADYLCRWGEACIEQNDYDEAEQHLNRSRQIFEFLQNRTGLGKVLYFLGRIGVERAQYVVAERLLGESLRIQEEIRNDIGVADVLYRIAYIRFYQENFVDTERYLQRALKLQESQSEWRGAIRTLSFLAQLELQLENPDDALGYGDRAMKLCDEYQEQSERVTILETISDIYRYQGGFSKARLYALESLEISKNINDRKSQAKLNYKLSLIEIGMKNLSRALDAAQESLKLTLSIQDRWGSVFVLWQLGNIHQQMNQMQWAHEAWERGLKISETFPEHPIREKLAKLLQ